MSAKRKPGSDLNQDNWDDEEEAEDAGAFRQASKDVLQRRPMAKGKRRIGARADGDSGGGGAFKGFSGFAGFSGSSAFGSTKPNFAFNTNPNANKTFATAKEETNGKKEETGAKNTEETLKPEAEKKAASQSNSSSSVTDESKARYLSSLRNLNESVSKWISSHVEENPFCILTPVFRDYEQHLKTVEALNKTSNGKEEKQQDQKSNENDGKSSEEKPENEEKNQDSAKLEKEPETLKEKSIFGLTAPKSEVAPKFGSCGIFGSALAPTAAASPFQFSFAKQPPGGASASSSQESVAEEEKEEEYVPPKDEVKKIEEKDAFYTKRCKLFYKADNAWKEKGLGNLHLKPCDGKTQLLIRADTNLGNILLNIMLMESMPASRQGKNNVAIVCVPNPPLHDKKPEEGGEQKAVSMLIRVKTSDDADELLKHINEAKEKSA